MGGEITPRSGIKHKHSEEEEEDEVDPDAEKHSSKRLKVDKNHEEGDTKCENKEYSCKGTEDTSAMKSSEDACSQKNKSETSCGTQSMLEDPGPSSPLTELPEKEEAKTEEAHYNQPERPLKENAHSEQDTEDSNSRSSRSGDCPPSVSSSGDSPDLSTEGDADNSECTNTETEPGQND